MRLTRRLLMAGLLAAPAAARAASTQLRIGYQKNGSLLILKRQGTLERALGARGVDVSWHEFNAGPPLLEALNAGSIDFGATGDTPPLFAQAAGAPLLYVAFQPAPGTNSAILVRRDGPVATLAELRGKRVAFAKGSSAHNVVVQALRAGGLTYGDIKPVYLLPADAAAAFRQGAVDAWSIWDPFYAIAQQDPGTRVLTTAEGIAPSNSFFLAQRDFARAHGDVVSAVIAECATLAGWISAHLPEVAHLMATETGLPEPIQLIASRRGNYDTATLTETVIAQQQGIADTFASLGLLPHPIRVRDAVWTPTA
jgi:aliphatic sulfonates family ABC transporter substrate-binding protein